MFSIFHGACSGELAGRSIGILSATVSDLVVAGLVGVALQVHKAALCASLGRVIFEGCAQSGVAIAHSYLWGLGVLQVVASCGVPFAETPTSGNRASFGLAVSTHPPVLSLNFPSASTSCVVPVAAMWG